MNSGENRISNSCDDRKNLSGILVLLLEAENDIRNKSLHENDDVFHEIESKLFPAVIDDNKRNRI